MSAVAASYADLVPVCPPLGAAPGRLTDAEVTSLLRLRFEAFLAWGYDETEALLRALGFGTGETSTPTVLC